MKSYRFGMGAASTSLLCCWNGSVAQLTSMVRKTSLNILLIAATVLLVVGATSACSLPWQQSSPSGNSGSTAASTATRASAPPTAPVPPPPPTLQFNTAASTDLDGLHIQTDGVVCGGFLVLKNQPYSYDDATLEQIKSYLSTFAKVTDFAAPAFTYGGNFVYTQKIAAQLPPVPDALKWVPGAASCSGRLDFTNIGNTDIQITEIGVVYDATPIQNTASYPLLDLCSTLGLPPPSDTSPCDNSSGSGGCSYTASLTLQGGRVGDTLKAPVTGADPDCPLPLLLHPTQPYAQSVLLTVHSFSAEELYRVKLSVTITTTNGTQTLILPASFTSTLAFASRSQFSCYQLTGNTFTPEALPGDTGKGFAFPCI